MLFKQTGLINNLNCAIDIANIAVNTTSQDYPYWASYLNNFRNLLGTQFKRTSLINNLNYTVDVADIVVNTTPQDYIN